MVNQLNLFKLNGDDMATLTLRETLIANSDYLLAIQNKHTGISDLLVALKENETFSDFKEPNLRKELPAFIAGLTTGKDLGVNGLLSVLDATANDLAIANETIGGLNDRLVYSDNELAITNKTITELNDKLATANELIAVLNNRINAAEKELQAISKQSESASSHTQDGDSLEPDNAYMETHNMLTSESIDNKLTMETVTAIVASEIARHLDTYHNAVKPVKPVKPVKLSNLNLLGNNDTDPASPIPKNFMGWTVNRNGLGMVKLFKKFNSKMVGIHIGKQWNADIAAQKIAAKMQATN